MRFFCFFGSGTHIHTMCHRPSCGIIATQIKNIELDDQLLEILSKRMYVSGQIGKLKKKHGLAPYQPDRWSALLEDKLEKAGGLKLDKDFVKKIYQAIHVESMKRQE